MREANTRHQVFGETSRKALAGEIVDERRIDQGDAGAGFDMHRAPVQLNDAGFEHDADAGDR